MRHRAFATDRFPERSILILPGMSLTFLEIEVANPARLDVGRKLEFLIDSGAIYSVVSRTILNDLGIAPIARQEFRLASGVKIVREKGVAVFRYGDRVGGADVIFGEEGDLQLLGAFTLEALGLGLDPLKRELIPLPMLLA
jgi:predicted aspartyl protease